MSAKSTPSPLPAGISDLRGASRMAIDAVTGITSLVEDMHRNIAAASPALGKAPEGRTAGITGLIYTSVRGVTRAVGFGIDQALKQLEPLLGRGRPSPRREAMVAALNGVLGDYLAATQNPLAIPMRLRVDGKALDLKGNAIAAALPTAGSKVLVLVHGLCMNDLQWTRDGHNHGTALAAEFGYAPLYLHYNSGLHISSNGRAFAAILEDAVRNWPVPVRELTIIGHSMGGLLARSAWHHAREARMAWPARLKSLVFLGTPHHGAPLERAGNRANMFVGISPYTAPFTRLGALRSAGIKDLRHGNLLDSDWQGLPAGSARDARTPVQLRRGVACYAIAASRSQGPVSRPAGDGLVPVASALGQHKDARFALPIPATRKRIIHGLDHFDLLSSHEVCESLRGWLGDNRPRGMKRAV